MDEQLLLADHDAVSDDEFDVGTEHATDFAIALDRLKEFSYYLVENVELNLNLCLGLLEERGVQSKPNSIYTSALTKLLLAVPKVGSALSGALAKGEIVVFDKIDKKNSRILADLVYHFSDHKEEVREALIESSIDVFYSFENQFMKLSCKGGPKRAMQKLGKDASDRIFNYFLETEQKKDVTRIEITKGVLFGDSKRNRIGVKEGKTVMKDEIKWKTCELYQKTGIVIVEEQIFFRNKGSDTDKYGHRRLFPWEKPEDIKESWEPDFGFQIPNYTLVAREDHLKTVRDYIMTKNPFEEARLARENYNREAAEDRQLKQGEILSAFQEHFKELLNELELQYKVIAENHRESQSLVMEVSKNQSEDRVLHQEISTKLEEIKKDINDTKVMLERSTTSKEVCVVQEPQKGLTVEEVKKIVKQATSEDPKKQLNKLAREALREMDAGPRIHNEINRNLKKLKLKW